MGKEYIPLFLDFNETTQDLTDEECGRLIRAIVDYANDADYEKRLAGGEKIAFRFLKGLVDRNAAISEKRAQARTGKFKEEQTERNDNKTDQIISNFATNTNTNTKTKTETNTKSKDTDVRFDRFWIAYPRHEGKQVAKKAFVKLNPSDELLQIMLSAIEKQKQSDQWTKDGGQFIPHPATWINGCRWEDEVPKPQSRLSVVPAQAYGQRDYSGDQQAQIDAMMQGVGDV